MQKNRHFGCIATAMVLFVTVCFLVTGGRYLLGRYRVEKAEAATRKEFLTVLSISEGGSNPILDKLGWGFEVTVLDCSRTEEGMLEARCEFSNYDMAGCLAQTEQSAETLEEYARVIAAKMSDRIRTECTVLLTEDYQVKFTPELLDDASGGLLTYLEHSMGGLSDG